jgi:hypothetical protein
MKITNKGYDALIDTKNKEIMVLEAKLGKCQMERDRFKKAYKKTITELHDLNTKIDKAYRR